LTFFHFRPGIAFVRGPCFTIPPHDARPLSVSLTDLAARIREEHASAEAAQGAAAAAARKGIAHALACGEALIQAKAQVKAEHGHGARLPWLIENCPAVSDRMARHYMRIARNQAELETQIGNVSDLSLRQAVWLLTDDDEADLRVRQRGEDSDEWFTPASVMDVVWGVLGQPDLDPASCDVAQKTVQAKHFYTKEQDGLTQPWFGKVFCNAPYSHPTLDRYVTRLIDKYQIGNVIEAILLVNNMTDAKWFHEAMAACSAFCLWRGRIKFENPDKDPPVLASLYGSCFFYFGKNVEKFRERFSAFGHVSIPDRKPAPKPKPAPEPARIDVQLAGEPFYDIRQGDVRDLIPGLPQVHTVISSPAYYLKIKYGDDPREMGHEADVDEHITKVVNVYRAIPLHPQGSIFVNLGDKRVDGDLLNNPGRFCTAMQAAGFVLKDHIIWAKAVAKVDGGIDGRVRIEPCAGRLNSSGFEPVFHFVRAGADPWTDMAAIQATRRNVEPQRYLPEDLMRTTTSLNGRSVVNVWLISGRNIQDEHYGCFPPELVERLVAGFCPLFVNPDGNLPRRLVQQVEYDDGIGRRTYGRPYDPGYRNDGDREYVPHRPLHMGWEPIAEGAAPGIICDPFAGTGTVGEVALKMGRSFIGCELYPQHVETARRRCAEAKHYVREHYGYAALYERIANPPPPQQQDSAAANDDGVRIVYDSSKIIQIEGYDRLRQMREHPNLYQMSYDDKGLMFVRPSDEAAAG
jgi:hypothetical protein